MTGKKTPTIPSARSTEIYNKYITAYARPSSAGPLQTSTIGRAITKDTGLADPLPVLGAPSDRTDRRWVKGGRMGEGMHREPMHSRALRSPVAVLADWPAMMVPTACLRSRIARTSGEIPGGLRSSTPPVAGHELGTVNRAPMIHMPAPMIHMPALMIHMIHAGRRCRGKAGHEGYEGYERYEYQSSLIHHFSTAPRARR